MYKENFVKKRFVSVVLTGLLASGTVLAAGKVHWGYSGHEGPEHWGELAPEYSLCATGKNQSPINITGAVDSKLPELKFDYKFGGNHVINNGHSIQVNFAAGNTITVGDRTFELKQVHFHSPSENTINGKSFPMEAHFVHADKNGNLAVVAVMYEAGAANAELDKAWKFMPQQGGATHDLPNAVNAQTMLPTNHAYYRFNGSLTTPPCSEGVSWFVMKAADTASQAQIDKFADTMHHANNRPVQPLNARIVVQ